MRLIIIRHGETVGNTKRILADSNDPLTEKGIEQAKKLSKRLATEKVDVIFSSPFLRAKETAKIIAKEHPKADFVLLDGLKEMKHGSFSNKTYDEVDWNKLPEDAESKTALFDRAKKVIEQISSEKSDSTVVLVGHNAINKSIVRVLRNLHPEDKTHISQKNTAVSIFDINTTETKELLFNCTKHITD